VVVFPNDPRGRAHISSERPRVGACWTLAVHRITVRIRSVECSDILDEKCPRLCGVIKGVLWSGSVRSYERRVIVSCDMRMKVACVGAC
jgi:hypothetical protein